MCTRFVSSEINLRGIRRGRWIDGSSSLPRSRLRIDRRVISSAPRTKVPADIIVAQKRASTPIKGGARHGNSHNTISMRVETRPGKRVEWRGVTEGWKGRGKEEGESEDRTRKLDGDDDDDDDDSLLLFSLPLSRGGRCARHGSKEECRV